MHVPLTTPRTDGVPVAHPLGPPLPDAVVRKYWLPVALLQNPLLP
jgi:hypothetical protein